MSGYESDKGYKSMARTKLLTLITLLLVLVPNVLAENIFGNLPDNGVYGGWCSPVALGIEVPQGEGYRINNVRLGLTHLAADTVTLQVYSDNDGVPGQAVATINSRTVTRNNIYTFDASTEMTLAGGQTYWLYVDASACNVTWDDIGEAQPSGDFSVVGYMRYTGEWVDASDGGRLIPALVMDATLMTGN
jgi:hypothetical protein